MDLSSGPTINFNNQNNNSKIFKLSFENYEYLIQLGIEDKKLKVLCQNINQLNNFGYKNFFSLENLQQINKLFLCFSNLEEVLLIFHELFKNNKIKINKEKENIFLKITLTNLTGKEEQISLKLDQLLLSNSDLSSNFCFQINHLKEIIEEEKKKNENLLNRIKELEEWKNIKQIINSKIIEKEEEINFIIERLKNNEDKKKKKIYFKLIYSAIEDGDSTSIFHQKCDGKKNVITFFHTIKEVKFGIYTEVGYGLGAGVHIPDDEIFHFNIHNKKIYNVKKGGKEAARCGGNVCGIHMQNGIKTSYNFCAGGNKHCVGLKMNEYYDGLENSLEINSGEQYFISKEVEVFQVLFI